MTLLWMTVLYKNKREMGVTLPNRWTFDSCTALQGIVIFGRVSEHGRSDGLSEDQGGGCTVVIFSYTEFRFFFEKIRTRKK